MADWVQMGDGVRRRILQDGEKLMLVQVEFEAGAAVPAHSHPHEQISYVVHGQIRFTLAEGQITVSTGGSLHIPSNVIHDATALEAATVLDAFSPPREEFRPKA